MVVGVPRCGTRFVELALGQHPQIRIQRELHPPSFAAALPFLVQTDAAMAPGDDGLPPERATGWAAHRRDLVFALWCALSKSSLPADLAPVRFFGHKTPRHDRYWEAYRDLLGDDVRYVFCLRDFVGHYRSTDAMAPKAIESVAREYHRSMARYSAMRDALGTDHVSLFVLNDLAAGGRDYVRETLFDRLGISVDAATMRAIEPALTVNTTVEHGHTKRDLTSAEHAFLEADEDLVRTFEALRAGG